MVNIPIESITVETIIATSIVLIIVMLLKGFAMYRAARKESKCWFWVLLISNTMGILPVLYLIFSKKENKEE